MTACPCRAPPLTSSPARVRTPPGPRPPRAAPTAAGKWLTGSLTEDISAVVAAGFAEARRRDPGHQRSWIALVDSNRTQIEAIEAEAARHGARVTILIDLIHVLESLWKAGWSFFEPGDPDAETWVAAQAIKILEGNAAQVAAGIRRCATTYGYSARERERADTCANYLTAKRPYLDYATALKSGWPIATGVIEGACRHIVKTGWTSQAPDGAWTAPRLFSNSAPLDSNGDFGAYWTWHLEQEQQRIHYSRLRTVTRPQHPRGMTNRPL